MTVGGEQWSVQSCRCSLTEATIDSRIKGKEKQKEPKNKMDEGYKREGEGGDGGGEEGGEEEEEKE